jgi:hypothetical protein
MRRAWVAAIGPAVAFAIALTARPAPAHAYEFWLRAQTTGQAYQLRNYRLIGPDLFLGRRRYSQSLALRIWDIGDLAAARRQARLPERGLRITWHSYLRIDHDFGDYTGGRVTLPLATPVRRDALDAIPELSESVASLDLLYGYLELAGLADDRMMLRVGRLLADDGWGTGGVDGVSVRFAVPSTPLAVLASAGLRVRASSPLGLGAYELDGTSGAACQEYVEGPTPGSGSWQLIDRNRTITNRRLSSDFEYCPQRDALQPTAELAVATARLRGFAAELGYRRTWSGTVGVIGPVDRLMYPDLGLFPDDAGQAPSRGVNEERLWARADGRVRTRGLVLSPYAAVRYSLLHAVIDRADAGVRIARGNHTLEPSIEYFTPTFDGDSIFNAFSIEPTTDLRLGYQLAGTVGVRASSWLRAYRHETGTPSVAGGIDAGIDHPIGPRWRARVDALWDDGYGGRRAGAAVELIWRPSADLVLRGRAITLGVAPDTSGTAAIARPRYVTSSTVLGSSMQLSEAVALHAILEVDYDAVHELQYRAIGVFDLAFAPEP